MLSGLNKAEKTPDKGWKFLPVYEETEEVSDNEDEEEVMLLEDKNEESSKSGVTKRCLSSRFKDPLEYVAKGFKIPKKSSSQNSCHGNNSSLSTNQDKGNSSQTSCDNHSSKRDINWGFESAFPETNHSTIQTRLTRNSSFRSKTSKTNIRRMVQRQDGLRSGICETRQNIKNSLEQVKVGYFRKNKKNDDEPFEQEINMIKERKRRTSNSPENNLIESDERKYKVNRRTEVSEKSKTNHESDQESQNISIKKGIPDEETTSSDETGDQYFENLYQEKLHAMSSNPEKDSKQKVMTESQERDCEENSAKENACQQCKLINFPSAAATPRHSIHEYSTSEDDKGKESNAKSFYGSLSKPKLKTYGNKKGRRMNDKKQWTNDDDDKEISIATSDVDDSPATNTKKRKAANKKSAKNNSKNENSNSEKQRKKHKTEPACYLISSSDEEDNHSGLEDGNISGPESSMPKNNSEIDSKSSSKATVENGTCMATVNGSVDNPFERDSFTTEIMLGPKVMLGKLQGTTYGALEITAHQLKWKMKYNDNGKSVEQVVLILAGELTSFKIHVDSDPKIIVLGVSPGCALKLRGKFSGLGKFFDPGSPVMEETEIVLQVDDALSPETMADITEWVKDRLCKSFKELSLNEAEQLSERLNSSTDSGTKCVDPKQATHYNTRSSVLKTTARTTGVTPTKMIIYPAPPIHGGITVTSADVECLAEGQFLNDVIIDFYLKYIYHDKLSEEDKKRTHIFSSFFYKRLTQKSSSSNNDLFQNAHDRMHNQVKKWTRHVDIFSKDFIIVPINESSHWYLAIICFPYLDEPIIEESSKQQELEENIIEDSTGSEGKEKAKEDVDVDEKTNKDDHDEDDTDLEKSALAVSAKKPSPSKKTARKNKPVIKANPSILIFDSLGTGGRSRVFKNLRNYLSCEWKARRPDEQTREFTSDSFKGAFPKVPEQHNHCDCGIFVLQYVESFFEDPIRDYKIPIHKNHWFTHDGISGKRQEIKSLILRLKEKYQSIPS